MIPEMWIWGLISSFLLLAIGTTLKAVEIAHSLKLANEEVARLKKQIEPIQEEAKNFPIKASDLDAVNKFAALKLPNDGADTLHNVLALIAKYLSQEIPATPKRIADDLSLDPGITLAHMWKYHNEQFISFRTGGKKPDLDTAFFLSPKAWELITIAPVR